MNAPAWNTIGVRTRSPRDQGFADGSEGRPDAGHPGEYRAGYVLGCWHRRFRQGRKCTNLPACSSFH